MFSTACIVNAVFAWSPDSRLQPGGINFTGSCAVLNPVTKRGLPHRCGCGWQACADAVLSPDRFRLADRSPPTRPPRCSYRPSSIRKPDRIWWPPPVPRPTGAGRTACV